MGGWELPNVTDCLTYDFLLVFHGNLVTLLLRIVSENSQQIGRKSHILGDRLLSDRCLFVLTVTLVDGWIKMQLGVQVGFGSGHCVR